MNSQYSIIPNSDDLVHRGILGMKWGVGRYPNKNSTLTPAGKKQNKNVDKDNASTDKFNSYQEKRYMQHQDDSIKNNKRFKQLQNIIDDGDMLNQNKDLQDINKELRSRIKNKKDKIVDDFLKEFDKEEREILD